MRKFDSIEQWDNWLNRVLTADHVTFEPCPFCGEKQKIGWNSPVDFSRDRYRKPYRNFAFVSCQKCGAQTREFRMKPFTDRSSIPVPGPAIKARHGRDLLGIAIVSWNTRNKQELNRD